MFFGGGFPPGFMPGGGMPGRGGGGGRERKPVRWCVGVVGVARGGGLALSLTPSAALACFCR